MRAAGRGRRRSRLEPPLSQILPLQMAAVRRGASAVQTAASAAPRADSPLLQPPLRATNTTTIKSIEPNNLSQKTEKTEPVESSAVC